MASGHQINIQNNNLCFQNGDLDGFVCEKCWWKVEIFNDFYNSIERLHQSTIFAVALVKLHEPPPDVNAVKFEEPDCIVTEQQTECQDALCETTEGHNNDSGSTSRYQCAIPTCKSTKGYRTKRELRLHVKSHHAGIRVASTTPGNDQTHSDTLNRVIEQQSKSNVVQTPQMAEAKRKSRSYKTKIGSAVQFQCIECPSKRQFATQKQLNRHRRLQHLKVQCDICNKFYRQRYLAEHRDTVHSGHIETGKYEFK